MSVKNHHSQVCRPLLLHFHGTVCTVLERRIFWTQCLLMEPDPRCWILTPSNSTVLSGPITVQAFGVCENETSRKETFIWVSQQMGPKCVSCSISTKHTQPGWWIQYPFWSINLTDWKGKGFFFNAMRLSVPCRLSLSCVPHPPTE